MPDRPTGTVTLLFTDMEGSTRLLQQLGKRYGSVLAECRRLLRTVFAQYNGYEIDTQGDAFFVAFARAIDAVAAAVTAQRVLASTPWPESAVVRVCTYPIRRGSLRSSVSRRTNDDSRAGFSSTGVNTPAS